MKEFFAAILELPLWTNIDFQDVHILDSINMNMSYQELKQENRCCEKLPDSVRNLVRNITAQLYEVRNQIAINIGEEMYHYDALIEYANNIIYAFGDDTLLDFLEKLIKETKNEENKENSFVKSIDRIIK